jgi:TPR repeat protein
MVRALWIALLFCAVSATAQVSGFRPLSRPEMSRLLTKAREGNIESQFRLGTAYQYGLGVQADGNSAEFWLKTAAGFGNPEAQTQLGVLYLQPEFASSREQAEKWFLRAASGGSVVAEYNLGLMYTFGIAVKANLEQGMSWFRRAGDHGSLPAMANLGYLLTLSPDVSRREEGFRIISAAAHRKSPDAENALGYCYQFGAGTQMDMAEAVKWYKSAAEHGNILAMKNLSEMYRAGKGTNQDLAEAHRWSKLSCEGGNQAACELLVNAYLHGQGVKADYEKAYQFALMAGVEEKKAREIEQQLGPEARSKAAEEAGRWKQAHAIELSALPQHK